MKAVQRLISELRAGRGIRLRLLAVAEDDAAWPVRSYEVSPDGKVSRVDGATRTVLLAHGTPERAVAVLIDEVGEDEVEEALPEARS